jgi:hypothetical protein
VVEGRHGDILTAVGSDSDHLIANAVLSQAQETLQQQASRIGMAGHTPRFSASARAASSVSSRGNSSGRSDNRQFGVVYEHRDCFGKPQFIGHTGGVPEQRFHEDSRAHLAVRTLLTYQEGSSEVVWAGTVPASTLSLPSARGPSSSSGSIDGTGRDGSIMQTITESIVQQRAQVHHMEKLRGPKPYSRHGY